MSYFIYVVSKEPNKHNKIKKKKKKKKKNDLDPVFCMYKGGNPKVSQIWGLCSSLWTSYYVVLVRNARNENLEILFFSGKIVASLAYIFTMEKSPRQDYFRP